MTEPQQGRTALYRLYDAGDVLLYVGITSSPEHRFAQHAAEKSWWPRVSRRDVEWYATRRLALLAEEAAIRLNTPLENIDGNPMAPGSVTLTLPGQWLVGLDLLCRHFHGGKGPAVSRDMALAYLLDRELAALGLLGDPPCSHSNIGWPRGVAVVQPDGQPCRVCGKMPEDSSGTAA